MKWQLLPLRLMNCIIYNVYQEHLPGLFCVLSIVFLLRIILLLQISFLLFQIKPTKHLLVYNFLFNHYPLLFKHEL